jgi:CRP-like cAMP-binding protein
VSDTTKIDRADAGLIKMLGTILGRRTYAPGTVIFSRGDPAQEMFAVLKGAVDIRIVNHKGQDVVLTTIGPGQFFGEMALMMHGPRTATARTPEGCEVLVLPRHVLEAKIAAASPFLKLWLEMLAARVVAASARVG